jgi:hypothetical protein
MTEHKGSEIQSNKAQYYKEKDPMVTKQETLE